MSDTKSEAELMAARYANQFNQPDTAPHIINAARNDFLAGARWLLEKAKEEAFAQDNGSATEEIAFYEQLEELFE